LVGERHAGFLTDRVSLSKMSKEMIKIEARADGYGLSRSPALPPQNMDGFRKDNKGEVRMLVG
jgi:hypothetical protein